ncbi:MAG: hypothetical protein ING66_13750 [Rhodocyclaceae bacterium]|nr:hypothetical protein [Rhodocyclaceae bacterium]MCA3061554.1 hypothetical protein [Rhodocyclaceae bacterium]MCA3084519.1 hypothetical protein [Rhodocyclaceae bacterium]
MQSLNRRTAIAHLLNAPIFLFVLTFALTFPEDFGTSLGYAAIGLTVTVTVDFFCEVKLGRETRPEYSVLRSYCVVLFIAMAAAALMFRYQGHTTKSIAIVSIGMTLIWMLSKVIQVPEPLASLVDRYRVPWLVFSVGLAIPALLVPLNKLLKFA